MTFDGIASRLQADHLDIFGAFHTDASDGLGDGTLLLVGPYEPGFWAAFTRAGEWQDGTPDPMDRWSKRVLNTAARDLGAEALFPFGEPIHPFFSWALRSGRAWSSPVLLLVHDVAGVMGSYRGALLVPKRLSLPAAPAKPCETCSGTPCLTACPVGALPGSGYDLAACHAYLDTDPGAECMENGCAVRRACPLSQSYRRLAAQSAYHMGQFHS